MQQTRFPIRRHELDEMEQSGDFSELESIIAGDRSSISSFLAAPVSLKTHKVYEIANYGSSMAPFYSVLSIWIGGIVLVAMLKVNVSEKCTEGLGKCKTVSGLLRSFYHIFDRRSVPEYTDRIGRPIISLAFSVSIHFCSCLPAGFPASYLSTLSTP